MEELSQSSTSKTNKFPEAEYAFISNALRVGLTLKDLDELTFNEVMKIIIAYLPKGKKEGTEKEATQADIDSFLG